MLSINKVMISGRLGSDPLLSNTANGSKMVKFNVAINNEYMGKDGQKQRLTYWIPVYVFNQNTIDFCTKYLKKGSEVFVEGSLRTFEKTDALGATQKSIFVSISDYSSHIYILSTNKNNNEEEVKDTGNPYLDKVSNKTPMDFLPSYDPSDDEIPF